MENFEKSVSQPNQKKTAIIYCRASNNDKMTKQNFICARYCYANNISIVAVIFEAISMFIGNSPGCDKVEELLKNQDNGVMPKKIDYLVSVEGSSISLYHTHKIESLGTELIYVPGYDPILENKDTAILYMTVDKGATDEEIVKQKIIYLEYCKYHSIRILEFVVDKGNDGEDDLFSDVMDTIKRFNSGSSKLITKFIYNDCFKRSLNFIPNMFESFGVNTLCIDECDISFIDGYYGSGRRYFGYNSCTFSKEDFAESHAAYVPEVDGQQEDLKFLGEHRKDQMELELRELDRRDRDRKNAKIQL